MDSVVFASKLDRLREGKLPLRNPDENGLGKFARQHLDDLQQYVAALEAGYRAQQDRLSAYRGQAKGKTLGQIVKSQWSSPAALGYAAAALRGCGIAPSQVVGVLEQMEEIMDDYPREWAEGVYMEMIEDPGGAGTQWKIPKKNAGAPKPEWIGAAAELKPEE